LIRDTFNHRPKLSADREKIVIGIDDGQGRLVFLIGVLSMNDLLWSGLGFSMPIAATPSSQEQEFHETELTVHLQKT